MKFSKNNIIDNWLEEHGNPDIDKFVEKNLAIADKVHGILKERNISKKEFAAMLGKKPSEITKLLSGTHNITLKSITKMEVALGIDLINIEPVVKHHYVYLGMIKGDEIKNATENVPTTYEESKVFVA